MYRVRTNWADAKSQLGAYEVLENAKKMADAHDGFLVFNEAGTVVYPIDYLGKAAEAAVRVYKAVLDNHCVHKGGAKKFTDISAKRIITCSASMSIALQLAGCLPEGKIVSHTTATKLDGAKLSAKKDTIAKCMNGYANLQHCEVVRVDKTYKELPAAYRKAGVCYIYDSNGAVSAGNGKIYSCNNGVFQLDSKKQYKKNLMTSGYCFTHRILYCIVPRERG